MQPILIKAAKIVNRGQISEGDILIVDGKITKVGGIIDNKGAKEIVAEGHYAIPGIIDDQVHFREPGLTHKANIFTESRAAVIGGVTSFMEMPNTKPPAVTQEKLAEKYAIGAQTSLANYSFFMGASNDNLEEVLKTDPRQVCGIKVFMGSSTGNMLVDDEQTLDRLFAEAPFLIATHCEDEATIRGNLAKFRAQYGDDIPIEMHPVIRNVEGCLKSSSMAVALAKQHQTRLHILHISTQEELDLFDQLTPLAEKRITAEVCVHHLFFNADDYRVLGTQIKCNPAIKAPVHQNALWKALLDNRLDIIATDHAPHTWDEKQQMYTKAPSGVPLVQHALQIMLDFYHRGLISLERIVEKMCHAPSICFRMDKRGYLEEGYWADLAIVDINQPVTIQKENIAYRCGWSPLEGRTMKGKVKTTIVSGHVAYHENKLNENKMGERLRFN